MRIAQASVALVLCLLVSATSGRAQTPTPAPGSPTPAPSSPTPDNTLTGAARVAGRVLTLEEAIAIALETQPQIGRASCRERV